MRDIPYRNHRDIVRRIHIEHFKELEAAKGSSFWNGFVAGVGISVVVLLVLGAW